MTETRKDADGMKASTGDYQAVPFSYSNSNDDSVQKDTDVAPAYSGYQPPFSLPQGLLNNLVSKNIWFPFFGHQMFTIETVFPLSLACLASGIFLNKLQLLF